MSGSVRGVVVGFWLVGVVPGSRSVGCQLSGVGGSDGVTMPEGWRVSVRLPFLMSAACRDRFGASRRGGSSGSWGDGEAVGVSVRGLWGLWWLVAWLQRVGVGSGAPPSASFLQFWLQVVVAEGQCGGAKP